MVKAVSPFLWSSKQAVNLNERCKKGDIANAYLLPWVWLMIFQTSESDLIKFHTIVAMQFMQLDLKLDYIHVLF